MKRFLILEVDDTALLDKVEKRGYIDAQTDIGMQVLGLLLVGMEVPTDRPHTLRGYGVNFCVVGQKFPWERTHVQSIADLHRANNEALERARTAEKKLSEFFRLLTPVRMALNYQALAGNSIDDSEALFSFMGGGASDFTTVGEFRKLFGDERALAEPTGNA